MGTSQTLPNQPNAAPRDAEPTESNESLREQSARVVRDLQDLGRTVVSQAGEGLAEVRERTSHAVDTGKSQLGEAKSNCRDFVTENPLLSIGLAAGLGCLVGVLVRR